MVQACGLVLLGSCLLCTMIGSKRLVGQVTCLLLATLSMSAPCRARKKKSRESWIPAMGPSSIEYGRLLRLRSLRRAWDRVKEIGELIQVRICGIYLSGDTQSRLSRTRRTRAVGVGRPVVRIFSFRSARSSG